MNEAYLKRTYGISLEDYRAIYEAQQGRCPLCLRSLRPPNSTVRKGTKDGLRPEVDHNHKVRDKRKSVRGLLCGGRYAGCNRRLGRIDSVAWLTRVLQYISDPPAQKVLKED